MSGSAIEDVLGRVERDVDREYGTGTGQFDDSQHRQDLEAALVLAALADEPRTGQALADWFANNVDEPPSTGTLYGALEALDGSLIERRRSDADTAARLCYVFDEAAATQRRQALAAELRALADAIDGTGPYPTPDATDCCGR